MNCNKDGKCKCKVGFTGIKCTDKDCVMSGWRSTSKCKCPEKTISRSRRVLSEAHGNGAQCGPSDDTVPCSVRCTSECTQHEFGYNCENQNCAVSSWSDVNGNICTKMGEDETSLSKCGDGVTSIRESIVTKSETYERTRDILVEPKGTGRPCPHNRKETATCEYSVCESHARQVWNSITSIFG